jgi:hypothetical protein
MILSKPRTAMKHIASYVTVGLLFASSFVRADSWIPYTDGRAGGCFLNNAGFMFGCTTQPAAPSAPTRVEKQVVYIPTRDPQQDVRSQQTQLENADLRLQLDEVRRKERERDNEEVDRQQRAVVDAELQRRRAERDASLAWLSTPEGQAQLAAASKAAEAQRAATTATMNAELEAVRTKPRSKARQSARDMSSCSRAGGIFTCSNVGCLCD